MGFPRLAVCSHLRVWTPRGFGRKPPDRCLGDGVCRLAGRYDLPFGPIMSRQAGGSGRFSHSVARVGALPSVGLGESQPFKLQSYAATQ